MKQFSQVDLKKNFFSLPEQESGGSQGQGTKSTEEKHTIRGYTMHRSTHPGPLLLGRVIPRPGRAPPCGSPKVRGALPARGDSPSRPASLPEAAPPEAAPPAHQLLRPHPRRPSRGGKSREADGGEGGWCSLGLQRPRDEEG